MAKASKDTKEWNIARMGISLLLNNNTEEAEALFNDHPHSFHIKAGRCFVLFMVRECNIIILLNVTHIRGVFIVITPVN